MSTKQTLKNIATEEEINYLLKNDLITPEMVSETPKEVREIAEKATEIEYINGLTVTIFDAVEPVAEWEKY